MQYLETCFLIAEAVTNLSCFNCLFPLDVQNEYSCYQDSSVIHGWLFIRCMVEKCAACQNHRKSNFVWHCFRFSPYLMRKRV